MKFLKYLFIVAVALMSFSVTNIAAKDVRTPIYIFGFAASFNDSTVYFTEVQKLDSAWVNNKTKFLINRNNYSYQLRDYIQNKIGKNHPTCIVMFATNRKQCDKKYAELKLKYSNYPKGKKKHETNYDVKYITPSEFSFSIIDASQQAAEDNKPMTKEQKKAAKKALHEKNMQEKGIRPENGKGHRSGGSFSGNGGRPRGMGSGM
ncbi:hypothetical protein [Xylanibacter oryzae]|uniref:hypothetical protein n=1 Tax=Xylanibacter oryzae TaxID=185293 RepID=UPI0004BAE0ED|nr:hypothetical protein [Xylanibacter oryzae]